MSSPMDRFEREDKRAESKSTAVQDATAALQALFKARVEGCVRSPCSVQVSRIARLALALASVPPLRVAPLMT